MKRIFTLVLVLTSAHLLNGQEYTIAKWLNNKKSATVLTYDDWSPGHGPIGVPNLVSRGLVGTFFVTTNNTWAGGGYITMNNNVSNGIEFANHTISHPNLTSLTPTELNNEIEGAKDILDNNISGQTVLTLAYPLGSFNQNVINETKIEHIAARSVQYPSNGKFEYNFAGSENDYYKIKTATVNSSLNKYAFMSHVNNGLNNGGMVVFMIHSIYNSSVNDSWYDAIHEDHYNELLDTLATKLDQTWNATFLDAICYHKEWHCASLSNVSKSASNWKLNLTDTLSDNTIYKQPLTLWLKLEDGDTVTSATQDGNAITYEYSASGDSIIFNAVPDGGQIQLNGDLIASIEHNEIGENVILYPNPTRSTLTIRGVEDFDYVTILDLYGRELYQFEITSGQFKFNSTLLSNGTYVLQLTGEQGTVVRKFVKN